MEKIINNFNNISSIISGINLDLGRNKDYTKIVIASKNRTIQDILSLSQNTDVVAFGENKAQELLSKYTDKVTWDFIGRLQTNKVKYIIDKVRLIHSVDRFELAKEIDKQAIKIGKIQDVLVEINSGDEENKGGIELSSANDFTSSLLQFENIRVCGLMAVAPKNVGEEVLDTLFAKVKQKYDELKSMYPNFTTLSMGMSGDYKIAVKNGATIIRPGHIIFE